MFKEENFNYVIFLDASIKGNSLGIGIYELNTKFKKKIKYTISTEFKIGSTEAELIALREVLLMCINIYELTSIENRKNLIFNIYSDNKNIVDLKMHEKHCFLTKEILEKISFSWIPREINTEADKLSKAAHEFKEIKEINKKSINYIQKKYSFENRIELIKYLMNDETSHDTLETLLKNKKINKKIKFDLCKLLKLLLTFLTKEELSHCNKIKDFAGNKGIKKGYTFSQISEMIIKKNSF